MAASFSTAAARWRPGGSAGRSRHPRSPIPDPRAALRGHRPAPSPRPRALEGWRAEGQRQMRRQEGVVKLLGEGSGQKQRPGWLPSGSSGTRAVDAAGPPGGVSQLLDQMTFLRGPF